MRVVVRARGQEEARGRSKRIERWEREGGGKEERRRESAGEDEGLEGLKKRMGEVEMREGERRFV